MANIQIVGFFRSSRIVNNNNNIVVTIDEYYPSYTHTKTGEKTEAKLVQWNIIFERYFIKFIKTNFSNGNLVEIIGKAKPLAEMYKKNDEQQPFKIGVKGTTISMHYNSFDLSKDDKRTKISQKNTDYTPQLADFLSDDF